MKIVFTGYTEFFVIHPVSLKVGGRTHLLEWI